MKIFTLTKDSDRYLPFHSDTIDLSKIKYMRNFEIEEKEVWEDEVPELHQLLVSTVDVGEFCVIYNGLPGFIKSLDEDKGSAVVYCSDGSEVECQISDLLAVILAETGQDAYINGVRYTVEIIENEHSILVSVLKDTEIISYSDIDYPIFGEKIRKMKYLEDHRYLVGWICGRYGKYYLVYAPEERNFGHSGIYNVGRNFWYLNSMGMEITNMHEGSTNLVESRNLFLKNLAV